MQWTINSSDGTRVNVTIEHGGVTMHIESEAKEFVGLYPTKVDDSTDCDRTRYGDALVTIVNKTGTMAIPSFKLKVRVTDKDGNEQKQIVSGGRPIFKKMHVHVIQMHTHVGYKKGYWIHHIDENKLNNSLSNLMYITPQEHGRLHGHERIGDKNPLFGTHLSDEHKKKLSKSLQGKQSGDKNPMHGLHWFTNGTDEKCCKECPRSWLDKWKII